MLIKIIATIFSSTCPTVLNANIIRLNYKNREVHFKSRNMHNMFNPRLYFIAIFIILVEANYLLLVFFFQVIDTILCIIQDEMQL